MTAFAWPFRRPVRTAVLLVLAGGVAALRWLLPVLEQIRNRRGSAASLGVLGIAFLAACMVSYLFGVSRRAGDPQDASPETFRREIDADHAWDNLLQFLGATAVAFLPFLALLLHALVLKDGRPLGEPPYIAALVASALAGTVYFPMALLMLGFSGTFGAAFNLPLGMRTIRRLGGAYRACVVPFIAAGLAAWGLETLVALTPRLSLSRFASLGLSSTAVFHLTIVAHRRLGLLYLEHHDRLGWSSPRPPS